MFLGELSIRASCVAIHLPAPEPSLGCPSERHGAHKAAAFRSSHKTQKFSPRMRAGGLLLAFFPVCNHSLRWAGRMMLMLQEHCSLDEQWEANAQADLCTINPQYIRAGKQEWISSDSQAGSSPAILAVQTGAWSSPTAGCDPAADKIPPARSCSSSTC